MRQPQTVTRICAWCGRPFEALRADAKYDSNRCRVRATRWRKALPASTEKAVYYVQDVAAYMHHDDTRRAALIQMRALRKMIDTLIAQVENSDQ